MVGERCLDKIKKISGLSKRVEEKHLTNGG